MRLFPLAMIVLALSAAGAGQVYCPRVTSEHNADTTDLMRFRNFHLWKDKTGNDLAVAVYQYLAGQETGIYHVECLRDGQDPFGEYNQNTEPLKLLNVYNAGYCATMHPALEGLWQALGYRQTRSVAIDRPSHCIGEVFYDGAWHLIDVDLRGIALKPDGVVASLEEIKKDPQVLVNSRKVEPFFPGTNVKNLSQDYARTNINYGYRWNQGSHTADCVLRPGESLTRWWEDDTGRWNHRPEYNQIEWLKRLWKTPPLGMKPNHRDFTRWNHGVGQFHYAPNLVGPSGDFAAGVMTSRGLAPGAGGLTLTAETGEAVFSMFTPFVIVPKVNDLDNLDDDMGAAVVMLNAAVPVKIAVSLDNGLTWTDAGQVEPVSDSPLAPLHGATKDLTGFVKGRYGYLLRLSVSGRKGDVAIRAMCVDTWVQVAPISLPRLKQGANRLRYDAGDRYGQATMPMLVLPNLGEPEDLKKYAATMPSDYDPKRFTARIRGELVMKLAAPAGTRIAWLSVGGTFFTYQGKEAPKTDNRIAYAVGEPNQFTEVYRSLGQNPDWIGHWRYNYDADVRLEEPAETVYLKFSARNGGVNVVRACLHLSPPRPQDASVTITHGYKVAGKMVEKTVGMKAPGDYTLDCQGEVQNVYLRLEKPSR